MWAEKGIRENLEIKCVAILSLRLRNKQVKNFPVSCLFTTNWLIADSCNLSVQHNIKWPQQGLNQRPFGYWPYAHKHWDMYPTFIKLINIYRRMFLECNARCWYYSAISKVDSVLHFVCLIEVEFRKKSLIVFLEVHSTWQEKNIDHVTCCRGLGLFWQFLANHLAIRGNIYFTTSYSINGYFGTSTKVTPLHK